MTDPEAERQPATAPPCVVWTEQGPPWRARVVLADASEHRFSDPAALAAFLSDPKPAAPLPPHPGLR